MIQESTLLPDPNPGAANADNPITFNVHVLKARDRVTSIVGATVFMFRRDNWPGRSDSVSYVPFEFDNERPPLRWGLTDGGGNITFRSPMQSARFMVAAPGYVPARAYPVGGGGPTVFDYYAYLPEGPKIADAGNHVLKVIVNLVGATTQDLLADAQVWATSDLAGNTVVAGPMPVFKTGWTFLQVGTNATYYLWFASPWLVAAPAPLAVPVAGDTQSEVAILATPPVPGTSGNTVLAVQFQDVQFGSGALPLTDICCWLTTDAQGQHRIGTAQYTAGRGYTNFGGLAGGTYYLWAVGGTEFMPILGQSVTFGNSEPNNTYQLRVFMSRHRVATDNPKLVPDDLQLVEYSYLGPGNPNDVTGIAWLTSRPRVTYAFNRSTGPGASAANFVGGYFDTIAGLQLVPPSGLLALAAPREPYYLQTRLPADPLLHGLNGPVAATTENFDNPNNEELPVAD